MANIAISDLRPAGSELFMDSESFIKELTDVELNSTQGGITPWIVVIGVTLLLQGDTRQE